MPAKKWDLNECTVTKLNLKTPIRCDSTLRFPAHRRTLSRGWKGNLEPVQNRVSQWAEEKTEYITILAPALPCAAAVAVTTGTIYFDMSNKTFKLKSTFAINYDSHVLYKGTLYTHITEHNRSFGALLHHNLNSPVVVVPRLAVPASQRKLPPLAHSFAPKQHY